MYKLVSFIIILFFCISFLCACSQNIGIIEKGAEKTTSENTMEGNEEPTPSETILTSPTPSEIKIYILDCNTDKRIKELKNNDVVCLLTYGPNISLEADSSVSIGSVEFNYDKQKLRVDDTIPYAIYNESSGNFEVMNFSDGNHILKISAFSQSKAKGDIIGTKEINFTVTNSEKARENVKKAIENTKKSLDNSDKPKSDPVSFYNIDSTEEAKMRKEIVEIALAEVGYDRSDNRPYMDGAYCWAFLDWVYKNSSYNIRIWNAPKIYTNDLPDNWEPQPGDLIKYHYQHYAMVEKLNSDGTISTIEGNYNNAVVRLDRRIKDWKTEVSYFQSIAGYATN